MHPYAEKLPELNKAPLSAICDSKNRLTTFEDEDQDLVSTYVVNVLARYYGGFHHFWDKEEHKDMIMEAWKLGINDLTPRQVFAGLYRVVSGDPLFLFGPPKCVISFKFLCQDSKIHDSILDKDLKIESQPLPCTPEVAAENLKKIRAMIKEALGNRPWPKESR